MTDAGSRSTGYDKAVDEARADDPPILDYVTPQPPAPPKVPTYRKVLGGGMVLCGLVLAVYGTFLASEPARVNVWVAAAGFIVWGLVVRFQHLRLW